MPRDDPAERWLRHSPMSDPGGHAPLLAGLPGDVASLCRIIGNLLIHSDWLSAYGLDEAASDAISRETLPMARRLAQILASDDRPLAAERAPRHRSVATCRDYALMLCAMLRHQGTPARVRCGFASYLEPGPGGDHWEDHWVCEHWLSAERRWAVADPQLDAILSAALRIDFDRTDLPPTAFITAGAAWHRCRAGASDPALFGHGAAGGLWFVQVNAIRDHLALHHQERSDWDTWREAEAAQRVVRADALGRIDDIAADPEQDCASVPLPPWR